MGFFVAAAITRTARGPYFLVLGLFVRCPRRVLGGSWVVISRVLSPLNNMAYKCSYPTYDRIYNYP